MAADYLVAEINPLKQGLKRVCGEQGNTKMRGCRDKSTKTRIETSNLLEKGLIQNKFILVK